MSPTRPRGDVRDDMVPPISSQWVSEIPDHAEATKGFQSYTIGGSAM